MRWIVILVMMGMLPLSAAAQTPEEYSKLKQQYDQLQSEFQSLKLDRDNLYAQTGFLLKYKDEVLQAQQTVKAAQDARSQWDTEREALKNQSRILQAEVESLRNQLVNLQTDHLKLEEDYEALRQRLSESKASYILINDLERQVKTEKKEKLRLSRLGKKLEQKISRSEELQVKQAATIEVLQGHIRELKEKYDQALAQNNILEKKLERQPREYAEVARENKVLLKRTALMHYNLGVFYTKSKEYERAIAEFEKAIELNPEDPYAYFNLGYIFSEFLVDRPKAIDNFEKYLRLAKKDDKDIDWVKKYILTWQTWEGKRPAK